MQDIQYQTQSWPEIVACFAGFYGDELAPMRNFVSAISATPFAGPLSPCASMDVLLVGRHSNFSSSEPHLRIWYNSSSRQFQFSYCIDGAKRSAWETKVPAAEAIQHFEHLLLRRLRWFSSRPAESGV